MALNAHALTTAVHVVHYTVVAAGVVVVVFLLAPARRTPDRWAPQRARGRVGSGRASSRPGAPILAAAMCSLLAAGVHAAVGPEHFREGLALGLFFVLAALAQVLWAAAVLRFPSREVLLAGAVGNGAIVVLWIVTRTLGLPFGLLPGPEEVGPLDILASAAELGVVVAAGLALAHRSTPLERRLT